MPELKRKPNPSEGALTKQRLRPFLAEVGGLSSGSAGLHNTLTYYIQHAALPTEHVGVHEEVHDRLFNTTIDGYLLSRLVFAWKRPETPKAHKINLEAWIRVIIEDTRDLQEATATYLSVKHFPVERHQEILDTYPKQYQEWHQRLADLLDEVLPTSTLQYLVAYQMARLCLSSPLAANIVMYTKLTQSPSLTLQESATHRMATLERALTTPRLTSLLEHMRTRVTNLRDVPTGFDVCKEEHWRGASIKVSQELERHLLAVIWSWLVQEVSQEMKIVSEALQESSTTSLLVYLASWVECEPNALLESTPLAHELLSQAKWSEALYRTARRQGRAFIRGTGVAKDDGVRLEGLPDFFAKHPASLIVASVDAQACHLEHWNIYTNVSGWRLSARVSPHTLHDYLVQDIHPNIEAKPPLGGFVIPLESDPARFKAIYTATWGALKPLMANPAWEGRLYWYLQGCWLWWLEWLVHNPPARCRWGFIEGVSRLSWLPTPTSEIGSLENIVSSSSVEQARSMGGLSRSTLTAHVLRHDDEPGVWLRAMNTWGASEVLRAGMALHDTKHLLKMPDQEWDFISDNILPAILAGIHTWNRL